MIFKGTECVSRRTKENPHDWMLRNDGNKGFRNGRENAHEHRYIDINLCYQNIIDTYG